MDHLVLINVFTERWNQFSIDDREKIMDQCIVLPKEASRY